MANKKDPNESMIGFKDFIQKPQQKVKSSDRSLPQNFDLLTLLEREEKRLSLIKELIEDKAHMIEKYSQSEKIIQEEKIKSQALKHKVFQRIGIKNSEFMQNLTHMMEEFFS